MGTYLQRVIITTRYLGNTVYIGSTLGTPLEAHPQALAGGVPVRLEVRTPRVFVADIEFRLLALFDVDAIIRFSTTSKVRLNYSTSTIRRRILESR